MFSKGMQFNGRKIVSFLLAVLMLTLAVTPALAWFDEGEIDGQAARPCWVIAEGEGAPTVYCSQAMPHHPRPVAEQPLLRPAIARAEQMFVSVPQLTQVSTK